MLPRVFDRQLDEGLGQGFELESVVDGGLQGGGILGADSLTDIGSILPDLVLEVGAGFGARRAGAVLSLEAAQFHGIESGHLLENSRTFGEERIIHGASMSSS